MLAKTVVKNKFWIVEDNDGEKVGTIQKVVGKTKNVILVTERRRIKFASIKVLSEKHNIKFAPHRKSWEETASEVYGYPAETDGGLFNGVYDISKKLPIYTKEEKSKSFFCAGYYLINYSGNWVKSYCPKTLTLDRNAYKGPYRTEDEMKKILADIKGL